MKKKVFEYIKANGATTSEEVSAALQMDSICALSVIEELTGAGYLIRRVCPLSAQNMTSCFYEASKIDYVD